MAHRRTRFSPGDSCASYRRWRSRACVRKLPTRSRCMHRTRHRCRLSHVLPVSSHADVPCSTWHLATPCPTYRPGVYAGAELTVLPCHDCLSNTQSFEAAAMAAGCYIYVPFGVWLMALAVCVRVAAWTWSMLCADLLPRLPSLEDHSCRPTSALAHVHESFMARPCHQLPLPAGPVRP